MSTGAYAKIPVSPLESASKALEAAIGKLPSSSSVPSSIQTPYSVILSKLSMLQDDIPTLVEVLSAKEQKELVGYADSALSTLKTYIADAKAKKPSQLKLGVDLAKLQSDASKIEALLIP